SSISDFDFSLEDIDADIGLNIDSFSSIGQVIFSKANVKGLDDYYCPKVGLSSAVLDYSYSNSGLGLRLQSSVSGKSSIEEVGLFSAKIDTSIQTKDFKSIQDFSIKAQNLEIEALPYKTDLNLSLDSIGNISVLLNDNNDFSATIHYLTGSNMVDLRLNLFEFKPFDYSLLYNKYLSSQNYIDKNTEIEGTIMTSVSIASDLASLVDISSSFDVIEEGRVSINTAIRNIKLGKSYFSSAFAFEAVINEYSAEVSSLAITAGGLRLSYGGTFNMKGLYPVGKLILQNASDGKKLASAEFTHVEGKDSYDIVFASPLVDADLTCALDILDLNHISADTVLKAGFLEKDLAISVLLQLRPFNLSIDSDQFKANAYFDDSKVMLDGQVNKLSVIAKDNLTIKIDSVLNGFYDLENGKYKAALSDFLVKISDTLSTGFDFEISNEKVVLKDLYLGLNNEDFSFDGKVDIDFGDIKELLSGDTRRLKGTIDLISKGAEITGSIIDQQYYLNVDFYELGNKKTTAKLSLLGTLGTGFYLKSSADWGSLGSSFVLNAQLKNGVLSLYDTNAMIGTLKLSNFNLNLDFKKMLLSGGFDFKNEYPFYDETTKIQSGSIVLGARFQALASNIFQIIAGLDYNLDFVLGIKNVKLADGYSIADTNVDVSFRKDRITVAGNSINGFFDLKTREIDFVVSRKLLFGFSLHGYVEKNLDLYVSELYFPLPVLNQFLNTPIFSIEEGIIEGDVLIRGPITEPTFYGMAYCQSFALDLLYLPEQTVNIKNCAFVFLDHSMYMTKTPFSCYSDLDGRYAYGDVTVEMIMRGLGVHTFDVKTYVYKDSPIDLWFPSKLGATDIELRGDVTGLIDFKFDEGRAVLETDIVASKAMVDFKLDNPPIWWRKNESKGSIDMNVTMTTGTNVEFFYPDKDNAFMNFTLAEGKRFNLKLADGVFSTDGGVALKSGQIYYFHNDFIVSEGKLNMTQKKFNPNTSLPFVLDLTATLIDYDANGNKVEINLILQNATLDNISPRFTSTPTMSQTEILEMLGQTIFDMSKADTKMSVSSLASIAATASSALTRVGVFEADDSYSLAGTIRKAIGLDVFSARSNILANIIVNALPGQITSSEEVSVLARYLDGTSIYAGKHLGDNLFFRVTFMLKADNSNSRSDKVGRFMAKDLLLDTEISIDFDNPMGTFNIFTKPKELSVFDVLDTIGFSVTKQIQF
ncbi:MAG: translocation/assembly module TamB domain-containing protein, partial [Sphaerochaetaceae bacterium]|nr:translocation/assembly module TamB domain-containing protein [Sphaerochaetaceae bacterium]